MRILIEDDSFEFGTIFADFLKRNNIDAITIEKDNEKMLETIKNNHFDIVIMDVLDVKDNIISKIKSYNTKVIVISAFDSPSLKREAIKNGADVFMLKPFSINEFIEMINKL